MQITIKDLTHVFSRKTPIEHKALDKVSTKINQGEFIGIIGPSGSGKTTLIEHLNGLLTPTDGIVEWVFQNEKYNKKTKENEKYIETLTAKYSRRGRVKKVKSIRKRVGVVFQFAEYQLFEETIQADIAFGPRSFGVKKEEAFERASKYLKLVGLDDSFLKKSPFDLSGGQKRRVALAGILAMEPDCIIADEPTAGLDPVGVVEILNIFKRLHEQGKTVIVVTHDLDNILKYTERVIMLDKGKIIKDGPTYDILSDTDFLIDNNMQPPKLLSFASKLKKRGITVPKVKSIDDLANFLNKYLKEKKTKGGTNA